LKFVECVCVCGCVNVDIGIVANCVELLCLGPHESGMTFAVTAQQ
jgi:hypothetical protein